MPRPFGHTRHDRALDLATMIALAAVVATSEVAFRQRRRCLGSAKEYKRLAVPGGGMSCPAFDLNHCYAECDVLVSVAKMKEDQYAGLSLSLKNMIGITPGTVYGDPREPKSRRRVLTVRRPCSTSETSSLRRKPRPKRTSGRPSARLSNPAHHGRSGAGRPVDLAIIDGIETRAGASGGLLYTVPENRIPIRQAWSARRRIESGVYRCRGRCLHGIRFCGCGGTAPFETCDSTLELAEMAGIGTRDLKSIQVIGPRLDDVRTPFLANRSV